MPQINPALALYFAIFIGFWTQNGMIARSRGAFNYDSSKDWLKFATAVIMIGIVPIVFFMFAYPVVERFPRIEESGVLKFLGYLLLIILWTATSYGWHEGFLLMAKRYKWIQSEELERFRPAYLWQGFLLLVPLPILVLWIARVRFGI